MQSRAYTGFCTRGVLSIFKLSSRGEWGGGGTAAIVQILYSPPVELYTSIFQNYFLNNFSKIFWNKKFSPENKSAVFLSMEKYLKNLHFWKNHQLDKNESSLVSVFSWVCLDIYSKRIEYILEWNLENLSVCIFSVPFSLKGRSKCTNHVNVHKLYAVEYINTVCSLDYPFQFRISSSF